MSGVCRDGGERREGVCGWWWVVGAARRALLAAEEKREKNSLPAVALKRRALFQGDVHQAGALVDDLAGAWDVWVRGWEEGGREKEGPTKRAAGAQPRPKHWTATRPRGIKAARAHTQQPLPTELT